MDQFTWAAVSQFCVTLFIFQILDSACMGSFVKNKFFKFYHRLFIYSLNYCRLSVYSGQCGSVCMGCCLTFLCHTLFIFQILDSACMGSFVKNEFFILTGMNNYLGCAMLARAAGIPIKNRPFHCLEMISNK
mgnify:CR=1 FL=1